MLAQQINKTQSAARRRARVGATEKTPICLDSDDEVANPKRAKKSKSFVDSGSMACNDPRSERSAKKVALGILDDFRTQMDTDDDDFEDSARSTRRAAGVRARAPGADVGDGDEDYVESEGSDRAESEDPEESSGDSEACIGVEEAPETEADNYVPPIHAAKKKHRRSAAATSLGNVKEENDARFIIVEHRHHNAACPAAKIRAGKAPVSGLLIGLNRASHV